jgi:tetratricopeptide (TPR) repeat protein
MNCHACGHDVSSAAVYCERCGSILRHDDPLNELARAFRLELSGRVDEAIGMYERLLDADLLDEERALVLKHLGNLHFRMGHLRRARGFLDRAVEIAPDNGAAWHDKGAVEYHMADFDDAIHSFRRAIELDPEFQLGYFWLGNALYHRGDLRGAESAYQALLERYPNFTIARFHLGVIYAREGKSDQSAEQFRRLLASSPEDAAARYYVTR